MRPTLPHYPPVLIWRFAMVPSDSSSKPVALTPAPLPTTADNALVHSSFVVPGIMNPAGEAGPHLPPALAGTPTIAGLLQALRRRWPLALALAAAAAVLAVVAVFTVMPAKYAAQ